MATLIQALKDRKLYNRVPSGQRKLLRGWTFKLSSAREDWAGVTRKASKLVELRSSLVALPDDYNTTLLHEAAHALDFAVGHDATAQHDAWWAKTATSLGIAPQVVSSKQLAKDLLRIEQPSVYDYVFGEPKGQPFLCLREKKHERVNPIVIVVCGCKECENEDADDAPSIAVPCDDPDAPEMPAPGNDEDDNEGAGGVQDEQLPTPPSDGDGDGDNDKPEDKPEDKPGDSTTQAPDGDPSEHPNPDGKGWGEQTGTDPWDDDEDIELDLGWK